MFIHISYLLLAIQRLKKTFMNFELKYDDLCFMLQNTAFYGRKIDKKQEFKFPKYEHVQPYVTFIDC